MSKTLQQIIAVAAIAIPVIMYICGFSKNTAFKEGINEFSLMHKKTSTWLYWLKFIMPLGVLLSLSELLTTFCETSLYVTKSYITAILAIYIIYICMIIYIYLGLSYLKKEAYLCTKYLFFIQWVFMAIPNIIIYINTGATETLTTVISTFITALIAEVPHSIYIGKRKQLFKN